MLSPLMSCYMNQVIQSYHNLIINGSSGMYLPKTLLFMSRILELFDFICNTLSLCMGVGHKDYITESKL